MMRPSPSTVFRAAKNIAAASAPTPEAAIRNPSVWGPPCKTLPAKIGIRTT